MTHWLERHPLDVPDRATPGELADELREATSLSERGRQVLDLVLRQWTLRALGRTGDVEGLLELDDLTGLAIAALTGAEPRSPFLVRWQAFRDLLESKRLAVESKESARAKRLLHAQPIIEALRAAGGSMTQSALQQHLSISPQRLSQVLAVMEEGGLVRREKRGKENLVVVVVPADSALAARPQTNVRVTGSLVGMIWADPKSA